MHDIAALHSLKWSVLPYWLGLAVYFAIGAKTQPNFENWRYFRKNQYSESVNVKFNSKKRRCEVVIKEYGDIISFQH